MIGHTCPRCRRKIRSGKLCSCRMAAYRKEQDKYDFYHSSEWRQLVAAVKARDGGIDRYAWKVLQLYRPGRTVHHIIPIEEDWDRRFDIDNLILVSEASHQLIHADLKAGGKRKSDAIKACRRAISG